MLFGRLFFGSGNAQQLFHINLRSLLLCFTPFRLTKGLALHSDSNENLYLLSFIYKIAANELYPKPFMINDGFEAEVPRFSSAFCSTERAVIFCLLVTLDFIDRL